MLENLISSLIITGIGMGLVFLAIILLWFSMAFLVNLTAEKEQSQEETATAAPADIADGSMKQKAAAVAVAYALQKQPRPAAPVFPLPPTAIVSAWQAVMRSSNFSSRRQNR